MDSLEIGSKCYAIEGWPFCTADVFLKTTTLFPGIGNHGKM